MQNGIGLLASQMADARQVGVAYPEKVRLLRVQAIPIPDQPVLRAAAQTTNLISPATSGLTLRYGIFIRADYWQDRYLVVHELAHTAQYERLGGIQSFLAKYLHECITIGYPDAPMEQEAIEIAERICG